MASQRQSGWFAPRLMVARWSHTPYKDQLSSFSYECSPEVSHGNIQDDPGSPLEILEGLWGSRVHQTPCGDMIFEKSEAQPPRLKHSEGRHGRLTFRSAIASLRTTWGPRLRFLIAGRCITSRVETCVLSRSMSSLSA